VSIPDRFSDEVPSAGASESAHGSAAGSLSADLSERERDILRLIVQHFIASAGPVGSRSLARDYNLDLSPASIRNTMSDLEDMGFLGQPHTSAGRVPTELGYRAFVDELMDPPALSPVERQALKAQLAQLMSDTEELLRRSTRLLGQLTNLLGLALSPSLASAVLDRLEAVPLSGGRVMVVLSFASGLVKTVVVRFKAGVARADLDRVVSTLNERLAGLTLDAIRETHAERLAGLDDATGLVDLVVREADVLFSEPVQRRLRHGGTQNILAQPEFQEPDEFRQLIEVIEDEDVIAQVLDDLSRATATEDAAAVAIRIGSESDVENLSRYSLVIAPYRVGHSVGTLGVIGPTRMNYARAVALVESMAAVVSRPPSSSS
jgi:heat-inducible transcriptional repressor